MPVIPQVRQELKDAFGAIADAIQAHRTRLAAVTDLVAVRPGFRYTAGGPVPAVVLAFMPPLARTATSIEQEHAAALGVPVRALEATPVEQLRYIGSGVRAPLFLSPLDHLLQGQVDFRPPVRGTYTEPASGPKLDEVEDVMDLTLATSPDSGWPTLQEFLAQPVQHRMQIGMYQFTAPHIYRELRKTMLADEDAQLHITIHPVAEKIRDEGNKADDIYGPDILDRLHRALGQRFEYEWMSVGSQQVFGSAYHIKVAVADGKRMWLSSGNWQSSNQPPYDPLGNPDGLPPKYLTSYNREHHVVINHKGLSAIFENYLRHDFDTGGVKAEPFGVAPDLLVPEEAAEAVSFAAPRYFPPLKIKRKVRVQPILTPDNYADHVVKLIEGAKKSVLLQNQYINYNPDGSFPEFAALLGALHDRMHAQGVDVRIICRDMMAPEKLDLLVALGFDPNRIKFLKNTHTKVIVVDGESVLLGSHNWSNEGVASNRDASLLFFDEEIAGHCAEIFEYDWTRAKYTAAQRQPRVARDDDRPSFGMTRLAWESVFDEAPPDLSVAGTQPTAPAPVAVPPAGPVAFGPAGAAAPEIVLNGIDAVSGQYLRPPVRLSDLAASLHGKAPTVSDEIRGAAKRTRMKAFGTLIGQDPDNIAQMGWGVVVPEGDKGQLLEAIEPLVKRRKSQVPAQNFKVLEYRPGERFTDWLQRHGVSPGTVIPAKLPYHLLLLGDPTRIPFDFQYLLDIEYSVGRLAFESAAEYTRYAQGVVDYETAARPRRTRDAAFFATQHNGDAATNMSRTQLADPLLNGAQYMPKLADQFKFRTTARLAGDATRAALQELIAGKQLKPALLFTASHGMGFPAGDPRQLQGQGALLTQDWTGFGGVQPSHYFTAADVPADADVHGLVAFLFACYGAGTPAFDSYPFDLNAPVAPIAPKPFVAGLPRKLLSHPGGGALGVFGHIERAWGYSITGTTQQPQINPFWNAFGRIMSGMCLGNATKDFNERSAVLSASIAETLRPGGSPVTDQQLVMDWIERNDAASYVLLGDPAARVRAAELV